MRRCDRPGLHAGAAVWVPEPSRAPVAEPVVSLAKSSAWVTVDSNVTDVAIVSGSCCLSCGFSVVLHSSRVVILIWYKSENGNDPVWNCKGAPGPVPVRADQIRRQPCCPGRWWRSRRPLWPSAGGFGPSCDRISVLGSCDPASGSASCWRCLLRKNPGKTGVSNAGEGGRTPTPFGTGT